MARLGWVALGVALAAQAGACGYPDFQFTGSGAGGTAATGATGGAGAAGGHGPKACRLLHDTADCGAGYRCTIVDPNLGTPGCVALQSKPLVAYAACGKDPECPAGTWCDGRSGVCMPFCTSNAQCNGGNCLSARTEDVMPVTIPNTSVCTANCDPVSATQCRAGATCTYDASIGALDCFSSLGGAFDDPCNFLNDCGKGLVCVGHVCMRWCAPTGSFSSDCQSDPSCTAFSNLTVSYDGQDYGFCN